MSKMMLHCGSKIATFDEVAMVETPAATATHVPISHATFIRMMRDRIQTELPHMESEEVFALNKEGQQLFGMFNLREHDVPYPEEDRLGLVIGFRGSHDKSFSRKIGIGASVFICDNLMFSGSYVTVMRKHTKNVEHDIRVLTMDAIASAQAHFESLKTETVAMKRQEMDKDEGFRTLGLAFGKNILTPNQLTTAAKRWRVENDHFGRNVWGLYNACTEGLKIGNPTRIMDRYTGLHGFFEDRVIH